MHDTSILLKPSFPPPDSTHFYTFMIGPITNNDRHELYVVFYQMSQFTKNTSLEIENTNYHKMASAFN